MDTKTLKNIFTNCIKARGTKNFGFIESNWDKVESFHERQSYITLDLIGQSVKSMPEYLIYNCPSFDLVIVAQLLQRIVVCPIQKYQWNLLKNTFGFNEVDSSLVQKMCEIRHSLEIPKEIPHSIMHDINLIRLSFPFEDFLNNQLNLVRKAKNFKNPEEFYLNQLKMFRFLLTRGKIYSLAYSVSKYQAIAFDNLERYCDMQDQVLDMLAGILDNDSREDEDSDLMIAKGMFI